MIVEIVFWCQSCWKR